MTVFLLWISLIFAAGRIKLKIVDDDKFLGAVGGKLQAVDYRDALSIKLMTMKDISQKSLEGKDGKALTESGFWFFPKSFSMKKNTQSSKQAFRLVYYAPEEYLLMRDDSCLGFTGGKFKKVDCRVDKATRFRICVNKLCDSYLEILNGLNCIMNMLGGGSTGRRPDDDSSSDDFYNKKGGKNKKKDKRPASVWGDDDSDDSDDLSCKEYKYGKPGKYGYGSLNGNHLFTKRPPRYNNNNIGMMC